MPGFAPSKRSRAGEKETPLNLQVVMNLICILIPALLSMQVQDYYRHDVELPTKGGGGGAAPSGGPTNPPFNLKMTIMQDGSFVIVNAKAITPADGLMASGPGLVVAPVNGQPDYRLLQTVMMKEHKNRLGGQPPEAFPDPDQITISAPGDLDFQHVVRALDRVRFEKPASEGDWTTAKEMFNVISLSPGSVGG
jgi:hypothetical protein